MGVVIRVIVVVEIVAPRVVPTLRRILPAPVDVHGTSAERTGDPEDGRHLLGRPLPDANLHLLEIRMRERDGGLVGTLHDDAVAVDDAQHAGNARAWRGEGGQADTTAD